MRIALGCFLVLLLGPVSMPCQAQEPVPPLGFSVANKPGQARNGDPSTEITLRFPAEATATAKLSAVIFLKNPSQVAIDRVKFLSLLAPAPGQTVSPPVVTLKAAGGEIPLEGLSVPAAGEIPVTVEVSNLAEPDKFAGSLIAGRDSHWVAIAKVTVERSPAEQLKVVGAETGAIKLESSVSKFHNRFFVESATEADVGGQVSVSPLQGPEGAEVVPTLTVGAVTKAVGGQIPIRVKGLEPVAVDVSARLDRAGKYSGAVRLVYAKTRQTVVFEVDRKRDPPTSNSRLAIFALKTRLF